LKFVHPYVEKPITIKKGTPYVLAIEHPKILSKTISGLINQIESGTGEFLLFLRDKEVKFKGNVVFFDSCHRINFNERTIWNRIFTKLQDQMMSEYRYEEYMNLRTQLYSWIEDLIFELDLPIESNIKDFNLLGFIKSMQLQSVSSLESDLLEQIIDVMKLYTSTLDPVLYIFQNLRSYLTKSELEAFYSNALLEKHRILLIENQAKNRLDGEVYTIIDYDGCVI
jgi:CRISPR type II-A-associated protein Csn2